MTVKTDTFCAPNGVEREDVNIQQRASTFSPYKMFVPNPVRFAFHENQELVIITSIRATENKKTLKVFRCMFI